MSFQDAASKALSDSQLRRNLGNATRTIVAKRAGVVSEMPDWQELRVAGAAIKDRALAQLDQHLARLSEAVERAGGHVHWARDAHEANEIVSQLVAAHGVREVVKVKSITTDEIQLNRALAEAGIEAVETDLAELILQLSDDSPSHILVPAIHRNRAEIREIFRRSIGPRDLSDDPAELCAAARVHLRRRFLSAAVGVSGANFAIAETGTVCVVESEGNGRMCLTLPRVLITVMGIEKVLPEWRDLEVFLQLLPRSSTGERMNPYTSLWTGVHSNDGPEEFHLVLLDSGRTDVLADQVGREALRCIRCSACLNACPVYRRTGGHAYESVYPGPIGAILTPQLAGLDAAGSLPYASSLCGACYEVCPVAIDIPKVLIHLRSRVVEHKRRSDPEAVAMRVLAKAFANPRHYERLQRLARRAQRPLVRDGRISRLPSPLSAWTAVRDFPPIPDQTFREWWRENRTPGLQSAHGGEPGTSSSKESEISPRVRAAVSPGPRLRSTDPREEMLRRVRAALADGPPAPAVDRDYRRRSDATRSEIVDRFEARVGAYRATVHRTQRGPGLPTFLGDLCRARGVQRLGVPPGLPDQWRPAGLELVRDHGLSTAELDSLQGAITGCALGIAETGTIVLDSGQTQGRRALSLVPDYHLCVVREEQILDLVPEAIERLARVAREGRPLTFVSGPSATSDIEMSRVEGVHGPRTLDVVIVARAVAGRS